MGEQGEIIMTGRLDAAQCDRALQFMDGVPAPRVVDLAGLGLAVGTVAWLWRSPQSASGG